jgi:hypothetical protein
MTGAGNAVFFGQVASVPVYDTSAGAEHGN